MAASFLYIFYLEKHSFKSTIERNFGKRMPGLEKECQDWGKNAGIILTVEQKHVKIQLIAIDGNGTWGRLKQDGKDENGIR